MDPAVVNELRLQLSAGKPAALITIVKTWGSTPRKAGSQMLLNADGRLTGSVGGGGGEAGVLKTAAQVLADGISRSETHQMDQEVAALSGLACGGGAEFFIQRISADGK